jgi:phosphoribosylglycinamide formyltransferase-1
LNLCVLASGYGSNLKSIIKSQKKGKIKSKVVLVISNNSTSNVLNIARKNQIPAVHLSKKQFMTEQDYVREFLECLTNHNVDLIILAGYMKLLPSEIIKAYKNRIINIHPALIPSFCGHGYYGMKVHEAVIEFGARVTGATVHIVDEEYDHGPIVVQKTLKVHRDDTPETLQKKVLKIEHKLLPEAIKLMESKKFNVIGRKVVFEQ